MSKQIRPFWTSSLFRLIYWKPSPFHTQAYKPISSLVWFCSFNCWRSSCSLTSGSSPMPFTMPGNLTLVTLGLSFDVSLWKISLVPSYFSSVPDSSWHSPLYEHLLSCLFHSSLSPNLCLLFSQSRNVFIFYAMAVKTKHILFSFNKWIF